MLLVDKLTMSTEHGQDSESKMLLEIAFNPPTLASGQTLPLHSWV